MITRKTNGYSHRKADARKERKRDDAELRQSQYDALSLTEKIARVKSQPGNSKRQLAQLEKALEARAEAFNPKVAEKKSKPKKSAKT
jgi:hypothetical protein